MCLIYFTQEENEPKTLLAIIALSVVQSSAQQIIHTAILFIGTSNNAIYNKPIG